MTDTPEQLLGKSDKWGLLWGAACTRHAMQPGAYPPYLKPVEQQTKGRTTLQICRPRVDCCIVELVCLCKGNKLQAGWLCVIPCGCTGCKLLSSGWSRRTFFRFSWVQDHSHSHCSFACRFALPNHKNTPLVSMHAVYYH